MQYIKKSDTPPANWDQWFTTANRRRSYDYGHDYQNLPQLFNAKIHLLTEQQGLCAYCQSRLIPDTASIEHLVPKEHNKELSTDYFNLVAVCKNPPADTNTGKRHCDKERGSELLPPIIQYQNAQVTPTMKNYYFYVYKSGQVIKRPGLRPNIAAQVDIFIDTLNLNHNLLVNKRSEALDGIIMASLQINRKQKRDFLQRQLTRILNTPNQEYRQFILIYLSDKIM